MRRSTGLLLVLLLIMSFFRVDAQSAEEEVVRLKSESLEAGSPESPETGTPLAEDGNDSAGKGTFHLSAGTGFSYMKGYGSGIRSYIAPVYTLPLSQRWELTGGIIASNYHGFQPVPRSEYGWDASCSSLALFAAATYRMNDRIILHGTGIKQLIQPPPMSFTPYPMDQISLGATYRITDNLSIGASVHVLQNGNYSHFPPFGGTFSPYPPIW